MSPSAKRCQTSRFQSRQDDIGHDGPDAERLDGKTDIERMAYEASAAIGADEPAHTDEFIAGLAGKPRRYTTLRRVLALALSMEVHVAQGQLLVFKMSARPHAPLILDMSHRMSA
jgi:hypothetical protein